MLSRSNYGIALSQQTQYVNPMLIWCWSMVHNADPTSNQHWVNVLCPLGCWSDIFRVNWIEQAHRLVHVVLKLTCEISATNAALGPHKTVKSGIYLKTEFIGLFVRSLFQLFINLLIHPFIHSFVCSFVRSSVRLFIYLFIHLGLPIYYSHYYYYLSIVGLWWFTLRKHWDAV